MLFKVSAFRTLTSGMAILIGDDIIFVEVAARLDFNEGVGRTASGLPETPNQE